MKPTNNFGDLRPHALGPSICSCSWFALVNTVLVCTMMNGHLQSHGWDNLLKEISILYLYTAESYRRIYTVLWCLNNQD